MICRRRFIAGAAALATTRASADRSDLPAWLPRPTIRGAGLDQVSIDIPPRFALPVGDQVWISPDETLQAAFDRPESILCARPGRYAAAAQLFGRTKSILAPQGGVVIAAADHSALIVNEGGTLAIGPGVALEGVGIVSRPWQDHRPTTILQGCSIARSHGNALTSIGGVAFSSSVRITASQYDGFNYGPGDDGHPNFAIEYNCHASDAGDAARYGMTRDDGSARDNLNGSSSHTSTIVRYGGLYEQSSGADIADTWDAGHPDQVSINYGVLIRASRIGVGFIFAGGGGKPTAYLNGCASAGETIDVLAEMSARVVVDHRSRLPRRQVARGGRID